MARIIIPAALRRHMPEPATEMTVPECSVQQALESLCERYPELKPSIFDSEGSVRSVLQIFIGSTHVPQHTIGNRILEENDEILLVPPIAGG